ncbi:hypothetical protein AXF42_Ash002984 [Apostasia shenzhenica]|uniref:ENT domain-containing protein n=1 Tax=Apostasia shenzhenica TaxID=1088818 RepID=A0A2I0A7W4_9ASPA|nr:hypothetical protein AXF42_Ash002984 [Apostasia shenzhenica]
MIFRKGSEVEVLLQDKDLCESWRPATIVGGNDWTLILLYDDCCSDSSVIRAPREWLRPRPPPVELESFAVGDTVEVLERKSWKLAQITRILGGRIVGLRLLGSSEELDASFQQIRKPFSWKDNCWTAFQNESKGHEIGYMRKCSNIVMGQKTIGGLPYLDISDGESSSVGSCCGRNVLVQEQNSQRKKLHDHFDHVDSFYYYLEEQSQRGEEEIQAESHILHLDSYFLTLRAFYACGSPSWEEELTLTDLRTALNITNEEHKAIVRYLMSSER